MEISKSESTSSSQFVSVVHEIDCPPSQQSPPIGKLTDIWILVATIIGASLIFIDGTVVTVALPEIQSALTATVSQMQWVIEIYALFLASLILIGGSLGDRFGRRRVYTIGIVIFALASLLCGLASNITQLLIARALQGIGGALLVPGSLAIISASFDGAQRGRAIGTWSAAAAVMTAMGPLAGGWIVSAIDWRWIFYLNVPLAAVTLAILFLHVPESYGNSNKSRLDWSGALLAALGMGGIVFGLTESTNLGYIHPLVLGTTASGLIALAAFIYVQQSSDAPMLPLALFRSNTFSGANLITLLLYAALYGTIFLMPFNLIQVRDYTPIAAGAAFLPAILVVALVSRWAGDFVDRFGAKLPLIVGPLIVAVGYALFGLFGVNKGSYWSTILPAMLVMGFGMGINSPPLTTVVMSSIRTPYLGVASGINNAVSHTAGLLSVALLGIVLVTSFSHHLGEHLTSIDLPETVEQYIWNERGKLAALEIPTDMSEEYIAPLEAAIDDSFLAGFRLVMWIAAGMAMSSSLVSLFMVREQDLVYTAQGHP